MSSFGVSLGIKDNTYIFHNVKYGKQYGGYGDLKMLVINTNILSKCTNNL